MKTKMYMLTDENIPALEKETGYTEKQLRSLLENNRVFEQDCIVVVVRNAEMDRFKELVKELKAYQNHSQEEWGDGEEAGMNTAGEKLEDLTKEIEAS